MKKKVLTLLLLLTVLVCLLTVTASAERYQLWVGGMQVTDENQSGEGWSYDPDTATLTLRDFQYTGSNAKQAGIYAGMDLTIRLEGHNNSINSEPYEEIFWECYGVYVKGALSFSGDGSLDVEADDARDYSCGISASSLTTAADFSGTIYALGGNTTGSFSPSSCGIRTGQLSIAGGTVKGEGGTASVASDGIFAANSVQIIGGSVQGLAGAGGESYGIRCERGTVTIQGADTVVTAGISERSQSGIVPGSYAYGLREHRTEKRDAELPEI